MKVFIFFYKTISEYAKFGRFYQYFPGILEKNWSFQSELHPINRVELCVKFCANFDRRLFSDIRRLICKIFVVVKLK